MSRGFTPHPQIDPLVARAVRRWKTIQAISDQVGVGYMTAWRWVVQGARPGALARAQLEQRLGGKERP